MHNAVSISVIVRTLGRMQRLAEALDSLTRQTRRDFEAFIVDMSCGAARPVVESFRPRVPQLTHFDVGRVLPRPLALNAGIRRASGRFIAVLDDDNCYEPAHLATLVEGLEQSGADLIYTGVQRLTYTPGGQLVHQVRLARDFSYPRLVLGNYIHASGTAFRKSIWEKVGGYDARFPVYEDWDFLIRVAGAGKIAHLPAFSARSRSFTGNPAVPEHHSEALACARCLAGLNWTHRRLIAAQLNGPQGRELQAEFPHMSRQGVRRATFPLLVGWCWHYHRGHRRKSRPWEVP